MMATAEEEDELYENLKEDITKPHRYEEISINFGKPVIVQDQQHSESSDLFHNVSFTSPIGESYKSFVRKRGCFRGANIKGIQGNQPNSVVICS